MSKLSLVHADQFRAMGLHAVEQMKLAFQQRPKQRLTVHNQRAHSHPSNPQVTFPSQITAMRCRVVTQGMQGLVQGLPQR